MSHGYFTHVKTPAQDDPCTLDQARALRKNNHFIHADWRNCVMNVSWPMTSQSAENALDTDTSLVSPEMYPQPGALSFYVGFVLDNQSGGALAVDFDIVYMATENAASKYNFTDTLATGITQDFVKIPLTGDGNAFAVGSGYHMHLDVNTGDPDLYIHYIAGWLVYEEEDFIDPLLYEIADDSHVRVPSETLNGLLGRPQFLGAAMYVDGLIVDASTNPTNPRDYMLYHLFDKGDSDLSLDKEYIANLVTSGDINQSSTFGFRARHRESSDSVTKTLSVNTHSERFLTITDLMGESWSAAAGTESVISADIWATGSRVDQTYIHGVAFYGFDPVDDLTTTRFRDSSYNTGVDPSYFDYDSGDTIETDTLQIIGRAQFNNVYRRYGRYQSLMILGGDTFTLGTSYVDYWNFYIWSQNTWFVNKRSKKNLRGYLTGIIENNAAANRTLTWQLSSGIEGDTWSGTETLVGNTVNYLDALIEIDITDTQEVEEMKLEIKLDSSQSITVFSLCLQAGDATSTY